MDARFSTNLPTVCWQRIASLLEFDVLSRFAAVCRYAYEGVVWTPDSSFWHLYPKDYRLTYYKRPVLLHAIEKSCITPKAHIELLIRASSNVDEGDRSGWTPLHAACWYGQLNISKSLIRHGANVNSVTTDDGTSPLMSACYHPDSDEYMDLIRLLITNKADVNHARTDDGWTALMIARDQGVIDILLRAGADQTIVNIDVGDYSW